MSVEGRQRNIATALYCSGCLCHPACTRSRYIPERLTNHIGGCGKWRHFQLFVLLGEHAPDWDTTPQSWHITLAIVKRGAIFYRSCCLFSLYQVGENPEKLTHHNADCGKWRHFTFVLIAWWACTILGQISEKLTYHIIDCTKWT